ncbi:MAG: MFS transporter [Desulfobacterales bacterium]|nr:MAG: MFS transporter [Desulfobacterales bacterium]
MNSINWKTNLAVIWVSQLLSLAGFFFALPFGPYYIQELGVHDPARIKFWVALFGAGPPLTLAIFSPIWGFLADRFGRRLMLLRANFGAAVVLCAMSLVPNVETLIILRLLQGALAGTIVAAQAMVAAYTPAKRSGMALGSLSAAVYSGGMAGTFLGGMCAEYFGYRLVFFASAVLLLTAGLLIFLGTKEDFIRPPSGQAPSGKARQNPFSALRHVWPILILVAAMGFTRQFESSFFPLLIQQMLGSLQGAAFWTGALSAIASAAGFLAGIVFGRLADHFRPPRIAQFSAVVAGLFMIFHGLARTFLFISIARFGMTFCAGGLDPLFQTWLAKETPPEKRGAVFGWSATARATGWFLAPLASGLVAAGFGIRAIYFVGVFLYVGLLPLLAWVVKQLAADDISQPGR